MKCECRDGDATVEGEAKSLQVNGEGGTPILAAGTSAAPLSGTAAGLKPGRRRREVVGRDAGRRQTGRRALARALATRGLSVTDGSPLGAEVARWREAVRTDLGGGLSEVQETILGHAAVLHSISLVMAGALANDPGLGVRRRQRDSSPLARDYLKTVRGFVEIMGTLGLDRRAKPAETLVEILNPPKPEDSNGQ